MFECNHNLSKEEITRYSRQVIVPQIGVRGQEKLLSSSVLIIGAGGLGCPVAMYCAAAGVGRIGIVDVDVVAIDNLHRQVCHKEDLIGRPKTASLAEFIKDLNSEVRVETYNFRLKSVEAANIFEEYDVIADCTDNPPTRYLINDISLLLKKPLVSGSALKWDGQLAVYNFGETCPCYRCMLPVPPDPSVVGRCSDNGVVGPVVGIIGCIQALEIIKIIALNFSSYTGFLFVFDGFLGMMKKCRLREKQPNCIACSPQFRHAKAQEYHISASCNFDDNAISLNLLNVNQRITARDFAHLYQTKDVKPKLIDIRPSNEYDIGYIVGAKNIAYSDLISLDRASLLALVEIQEEYLKKEKLYVICRRGNRSQLAVLKLMEIFADLPSDTFVDIVGGYESWTRHVDNDFPIY